MAVPFDSLPRASFLGIEFLCDRTTIKGGVRDHVHEYPHTAGGRPEKLGRKLYTVSMDMVFIVDHPGYPNGWPGDIGLLRSQFENQITGDLVIPTVGTIQAYAVDWDVEQTNRMRNGERMKVTFREDQEIDQLVTSPLVFQYTSIRTVAQTLIDESIAAGFSPDFFGSIFALANEVQGLVDQVELQADVLSTKVDQLTSACQTFDSIVDKLNDPPSHKVVAALQNLGVAAGNLQRNTLSKLSPVSLFVTPAVMTIQQLSTAIYGDTSRAVELLKLNPFEDAFRIPQGFSVKGYPKAA